MENSNIGTKTKRKGKKLSNEDWTSRTGLGRRSSACCSSSTPKGAFKFC